MEIHFGEIVSTMPAALQYADTKAQDPKIQALLRSATDIFSQKGFAETTISEIARGAQITPSGIYNHFSGKEEILYTIIHDFLRMSLDVLKEHLEGIRGAENKLRKAIWCHCKLMTTHRSEAAIVLEARSYPKVYGSPAFSAMKEYASVIIGIIEEGMGEGLIRNLTTPRLIRDMIYGAVDDLTFNWITQDGPSPFDRAAALSDMIIRAIRPATAAEASRNDPKALKQRNILKAATRSFARNGYNETSMADIAKEAGVAEGTIYEYYLNKENLLISIPEDKLTQLRDHMSGRSSEQRLRRAIRDLFAFYNDNRDFSTILVLMLRANKNFIHSPSHQIYGHIFDILEDIIDQGRQAKTFAPDADLGLFQSLVYGTLDHIIIPWVIFNRPYDLMPVGEEACDLFTSALKA